MQFCPPKLASANNRSASRGWPPANETSEVKRTDCQHTCTASSVGAQSTCKEKQASGRFNSQDRALTETQGRIH